MALSTSRFEKQQIVNSFNVFVDSEKATQAHEQNKGDDTHLHFEGNSVVANDGEIIRISLQDFTMFNNIHMINATNCRFQLLGTGNLAQAYDDVIFMSNSNYNNLKDVATEFANRLAAYLAPKAIANGASTLTSFELTTVLPSTTSMSATDNRLLYITLTAKNGATTINHNLSGIKIQFKESLGDLYQIIGGNRQDDPTDTTFNSLNVVITNTTIRISGFYPMQRMSDPYVYLRCSNSGNSLEMSVLQNDHAGKQNSDIVNSDILAKMFRHDEFISFTSGTGLEYFVNLQQKKLSNLRLFLTDSKGRKLGRLSVNRETTNTASGAYTIINLLTGEPANFADAGQGFQSNNQSTLGNLYFTCTLRVDILKVSDPIKLETARLPAPPPRGQAPLTWGKTPNTTPFLKN